MQSTAAIGGANLPVREEVLMTPIQTANDLGAAIGRARRGLGLTQRDLALAVGVGERFVVELESGKPTAQIGKALAVARAAGIRLVDAAEIDSWPT